MKWTVLVLAIVSFSFFGSAAVADEGLNSELDAYLTQTGSGEHNNYRLAAKPLLDFSKPILLSRAEEKPPEGKPVLGLKGLDLGKSPNKGGEKPWYEDLGFSFTSGWWESYLSDSGVTYYDDNEFWGDIYLTYGNWFLDVWAITGPDGDFGGGADEELDLTVGYGNSFKLTETQDLNWSLAVGYFFLYPRSAGIDMMQFIAKADAPEALGWGITPCASFKYSPVFGGPNSGWYADVGVSKDFDLGSGFSLNVPVAVAYESDIFDGEAGANLWYRPGMTYSFSESVKLSVCYDGRIDFCDRKDRKTFDGRFGITLSISF